MQPLLWSFIISVLGSLLNPVHKADEQDFLLCAKGHQKQFKHFLIIKDSQWNETFHLSTLASCLYLPYFHGSYPTAQAQVLFFWLKPTFLKTWTNSWLLFFLMESWIQRNPELFVSLFLLQQSSYRLKFFSVFHNA